MNTLDKLKETIKYRSEEGGTFQYWLDNTLVNFFLRERANYFSKDAIIKVKVELNEGSLKKWGMTALEVRDYLSKEGFVIENNPGVYPEYQEICFIISFDGMDEFLKSFFNE